MFDFALVILIICLTCLLASQRDFIDCDIFSVIV